MRDDDALFRALLGLPHEPAVIRLSVVATSFPELGQGELISLKFFQSLDARLQASPRTSPCRPTSMSLSSRALWLVFTPSSD